MSAHFRIVVIGGSTPFVTPFFDELADRVGPSTPYDWASTEIVLAGRDAAALSLVASYGAHRMSSAGCDVRWTVDLPAALDGADLVVHQNRYGGLNGRALDEQLARSLGVPADETLGPSGLQAAIRMAPGLRTTARALDRYCPEAVALNLTNPLSCSTALLAQWSRCLTVGLCELPAATVVAACEILGVDPEAADWDYVGLNHRGFISRLQHKGRDLIADLGERLAGVPPHRPEISAITRADLAELGAIPLKYFSLLTRPPGCGASRAIYLQDVRRRALEDLRARPSERPRSLAGRDQPWYRQAVVPFVLAWHPSGDGCRTEHVVNLLDDSGIASEIRVDLIDGTLRPRPLRSEPSSAVRKWVEAFRRHEGLVMDAIQEPSRVNVRSALEADPLVSELGLDAALTAIAASLPGAGGH